MQSLPSMIAGRTHSTTLNKDGEYVFLALPPSLYTVIVEAPGFGNVINRDLRLLIGHVESLPVTLTLAAVNETMTVNSSAELVDTQQVRAGTTVEQIRIDNLPINGRNYLNIALTDSQLNRDNSPSIAAAPTSGLNIGGQRARNNLVTVDGANAIDHSTNGVRSTVSQDAVQEFQITCHWLCS